eukprot:GGOE01010442.1.p3 GENE.GGOE01010442.1~~GGOE01010442.1.p3  ORF type:complete len:105 (+),score=0.69 GGOE01010442.1:152-466(+)
MMRVSLGKVKEVVADGRGRWRPSWRQILTPGWASPHPPCAPAEKAGARVTGGGLAAYGCNPLWIDFRNCMVGKRRRECPNSTPAGALRTLQQGGSQGLAGGEGL